jgi:hypothetical protein
MAPDVSRPQNHPLGTIDSVNAQVPIQTIGRWGTDVRAGSSTFNPPECFAKSPICSGRQESSQPMFEEDPLDAVLDQRQSQPV